MKVERGTFRRGGLLIIFFTLLSGEVRPANWRCALPIIMSRPGATQFTPTGLNWSIPLASQPNGNRTSWRTYAPVHPVLSVVRVIAAQLGELGIAADALVTSRGAAEMPLSLWLALQESGQGAPVDILTLQVVVKGTDIPQFRILIKPVTAEGGTQVGDYRVTLEALRGNTLPQATMQEITRRLALVKNTTLALPIPDELMVPLSLFSNIRNQVLPDDAVYAPAGSADTILTTLVTELATEAFREEGTAQELIERSARREFREQLSQRIRADFYTEVLKTGGYRGVPELPLAGTKAFEVPICRRNIPCFFQPFGYVVARFRGQKPRSVSSVADLKLWAERTLPRGSAYYEGVLEQIESLQLPNQVNRLTQTVVIPLVIRPSTGIAIQLRVPLQYTMEVAPSGAITLRTIDFAVPESEAIMASISVPWDANPPFPARREVEGWGREISQLSHALMIAAHSETLARRTLSSDTLLALARREMLTLTTITAIPAGPVTSDIADISTPVVRPAIIPPAAVSLPASDGSRRVAVPPSAEPARSRSDSERSGRSESNPRNFSPEAIRVQTELEQARRAQGRVVKSTDFAFLDELAVQTLSNLENSKGRAVAEQASSTFLRLHQQQQDAVYRARLQAEINRVLLHGRSITGGSPFARAYSASYASYTHLSPLMRDFLIDFSLRRGGFEIINRAANGLPLEEVSLRSAVADTIELLGALNFVVPENKNGRQLGYGDLQKLWTLAMQFPDFQSSESLTLFQNELLVRWFWREEVVTVPEFTKQALAYFSALVDERNSPSRVAALQAQFFSGPYAALESRLLPAAWQAAGLHALAILGRLTRGPRNGILYDDWEEADWAPVVAPRDSWNFGQPNDGIEMAIGNQLERERSRPRERVDVFAEAASATASASPVRAPSIRSSRRGPVRPGDPMFERRNFSIQRSDRLERAISDLRETFSHFVGWSRRGSNSRTDLADARLEDALANFRDWEPAYGEERLLAGIYWAQAQAQQIFNERESDTEARNAWIAVETILERGSSVAGDESRQNWWRTARERLYVGSAEYIYQQMMIRIESEQLTITEVTTFLSLAQAAARNYVQRVQVALARIDDLRVSGQREYRPEDGIPVEIAAQTVGTSSEVLRKHFQNQSYIPRKALEAWVTNTAQIDQLAVTIPN